MAPAQIETRTVGCTATIFHPQPDQLLLKEGGQVPGYVGHCPLLRYDFGKTFGQGTHEAYLSRKGLPVAGRDLEHQTLNDRFERSRTIIGSPGAERPRVASGTVRERSQEIILTKKGRERRTLPEYDGVNKYTENMIPGYTGYIPRYPFQFGSTYKEECDVCLDEHFSNLERQRTQRLNRSLRSSQSAGNLNSVSGDPLVRDRLNNISGPQHPNAKLTPRLGVYNPPVLDKDCEIPIPGYRGFIPRVRTTDIGLGTRYTEQTKNGLDSFYEKKLEREAKLGLKPPFQGQDNASLRASREISIDRNPVTIDNATRWSSNFNTRTSDDDKVSGGRNQTYQTSLICDHREHNGSNYNSTQKSTSNRVPKSVAFVV